MSEKKQADQAVEKQNPYIIQLSKPFTFEGEEYNSIDLSGLDKLSTRDLLEAERSWMRKGNATMQLETNMAYCIEVAAVASGKPIEFFEKLPKRDGLAVKMLVQQDFLDVLE